jgi:hypothetical protein
VDEAPSACLICGRPLTGWRWHCEHPQCDWIRWDGCGHLHDLTRKGKR